MSRLPSDTRFSCLSFLNANRQWWAPAGYCASVQAARILLQHACYLFWIKNTTFIVLYGSQFLVSATPPPRRVFFSQLKVCSLYQLCQGWCQQVFYFNSCSNSIIDKNPADVNFKTINYTDNLIFIKLLPIYSLLTFLAGNSHFRGRALYIFMVLCIQPRAVHAVSNISATGHVFSCYMYVLQGY